MELKRNKGKNLYWYLYFSKPAGTARIRIRAAFLNADPDPKQREGHLTSVAKHASSN